MYYTHYFANHATLDRVRSWLHTLGFAPASIEAHADGIPRITVALDPAWLAGVQMLIDAVERSDPRGCPGLWDVAHQDHVYPAAGEPAAARRARVERSAAIGWHPFDAPTAVTPDLDAASLAMVRKWGRG